MRPCLLSPAPRPPGSPEPPWRRFEQVRTGHGRLHCAGNWPGAGSRLPTLWGRSPGRAHASVVRSGRWAAGLGRPCSRAESSGVSVTSVTGTISWPHSRRQRLRGAAGDDSCSRGRGSWCPPGAVWGQAQAAAGGRDPVSRALCRHCGCRRPTRAPRRPGPRGGLQSNDPSPLPAPVPRPVQSLPSLAELGGGGGQTSRPLRRPCCDLSLWS